MKPTRDTRHALPDLLERVRDRGISVHTDLVISVAGIPLIAVNLRAAVVGTEALLRYRMAQQ